MKTRIAQADRIVPFCTVVSIPAGVTPKNIVVGLPGADGARALARWNGRPPLVVGDTVKLLRRGADGLYEVYGVDSGTAQDDPKDNLSATTDPTAADDSGDGYGIGSTWINTTSLTAFICLDATANAAVWRPFGNSELDTWFLHEDDADVAGYEQLLTSPAGGAEATDTAVCNNAGGEVAIDEYISYPTTGLGTTILPGGAWQFITFASVDNDLGVSQIVIRVYKRTSGGTETELFNVTTPEIAGSSAVSYEVDTVQTDFIINSTDRLVIKYLAKTTSVPNRTVSLYFEGTDHYSHVHTPFTIPATGGGGAWPSPGKAMIGATEYATVNAALTAMSAGDTIKAGEGTHTLSAYFNPSVAGAIIGLDPARTIIVYSGNHSLYFNNVTFEVIGLTVNNAGTADTYGCITALGGAVVRIENCILNKTGAATTGYGVLLGDGTFTLKDCTVNASGATNNRAVGVTLNTTTTVDIIGGKLNGASADIWASETATIITLANPILAGGAVDVVGILRGTALDVKGRDCGAVVKNTSGGTLARRAAGHLDSAGEFKTTTTAQADLAWHIATIGGPNNGYIFAKNEGNATVTYTGTAPNAGEYLVTSTTGGSAQAQTTMHPAIFAVCLAAGSGGEVEVLLLCRTQFVPKVHPTSLIIYVGSASTSDFVALINAGGSGGLTTTNVPYDTISVGAANVIKQVSSFANFVLWNTTRNTSRLISSVDTANSKITTVASTDAWADNDAITIRSQTATTVGANKYLEVSLTLATATVPVLARGLSIALQKSDTGGVAGFVVHTLETVSGTKQIVVFSQVANVLSYQSGMLPLINQKFCISFTATGAGTSSQGVSLTGYFLATP